MNITREQIIDHDVLEWFGFSRVGNDDLTWQHPHLLPRNMHLVHFDLCYHFVVRNTMQGIGAMYTIDQLVNGFKFVTSFFDGNGCKTTGFDLLTQKIIILP